MRPSDKPNQETLLHPDSDVRKSAVYRLAQSNEDHPVNLEAGQDDFEDDEVIGKDDSISEALEPEQPPTIVRREHRVGRNEPCPCGSGKKFKECCYRP